MLTCIAAIGKNRELGKDNQLIWHLPRDLKFFRVTTTGHSIVMGRKTFESLPGLLPGRHHIVITRSIPAFQSEVEVFSSVESFLNKYRNKEEEIFVIGGASIYAQLLPYCDRLLLTEIDDSYDADVFFPEFDKSLYERTVLSDITENNTHYQHVEYRKK